MERFGTLRSIACPLGLANVDTDQLIPARFMKRSRADGYGGFLLHDLRFKSDGTLDPGLALNASRYEGAAILVARRNFGTGSSREAAVYALWDYGIRCVIAPSFGDIFSSNAVKNGLLPAVVTEAEVEHLIGLLEQAEKPDLLVDLEASTIQFGEITVRFSVDPIRRLQLLNGWDDLDLTRQFMAEITAFRDRDNDLRPWARPSSSRSTR